MKGNEMVYLFTGSNYKRTQRDDRRNRAGADGDGVTSGTRHLDKRRTAHAPQHRSPRHAAMMRHVGIASVTGYRDVHG